jgi:hypothetical protein
MNVQRFEINLEDVGNVESAVLLDVVESNREYLNGRQSFAIEDNGTNQFADDGFPEVMDLKYLSGTNWKQQQESGGGNDNQLSLFAIEYDKRMMTTKASSSYQGKTIIAFVKSASYLKIVRYLKCRYVIFIKMSLKNAKSRV